MDRLAPEDVQAIVSGVASNPQLVAGIVAQLKEAIQPSAPTPSITNPQISPPTDGTQQSGQQPPQQDPPLPQTQGLLSYLDNYSCLPGIEYPNHRLPRLCCSVSSHGHVPLNRE